MPNGNNRIERDPPDPVAAMSELTVLETTPPADTEFIGKRLIVLDTVGSTNDYASSLVQRGEAGEGTVIFTEEQTGGRGRFGHAWYAPRGTSILMSAVITPPISAEQIPAVTAIGALAVVEAIREEFGLDAKVRWPNDAVIDHLKFAGVLARAERFGRPGQCFILGIGLNVNVDRRDLPKDFAETATSLKVKLGAEVSRERVARALLSRLDRWYRKLKLERFDDIEDNLRGYSSLTGRTVTLECRGKQRTGTVIGLSLFQGLQLRLSDYTTGFFPESLTTLISK